MQDFKDLETWKKSKDFCLDIYRITYRFPKEEQYGLVSQLRRAAVSIGANIAEGCGRMSNKEFAKYLHYSIGSLKECEYYLILATEMKFINEKEYTALDFDIQKISKMLHTLLHAVKRRTVPEFNQQPLTPNSKPQTPNHIYNNQADEQGGLSL